MIDETSLTYDAAGLLPAIIQDEENGQVLMLAYMNAEAVKKTCETGVTWFYSRKRKRLWQKGETSGNVQRVKRIAYDCDADTLLVTVVQSGPACHEGTRSCFSRLLDGGKAEAPLTDPADMYGGAASVLQDVFQVICDRKMNPKEGSYTTYLFEKGQDKILKKVGEEAAETIIASKNNDKKELLYEMADLWYHNLVLLAYHGVTPTELLAELAGRRKG
ncbi:bifunctional phosphoribosyl-AMP cyclohydrolase/phosphoribosyl-ATP diphosphatase HisIE [Azotosporobacter soli]|uniref:bifunctional phosphoribosyl-AMP cyclohydrolase/phosphoribosyl-ATP diphosphatase HisIE n=1 Tax=Azotosporobacter soli TaxID=3055040 RepID=UPI0031FF442E